MKPIFFQKTAIDFLNTWANTPYTKTNSLHKTAFGRIKSELWVPTRFWADEIAKRQPNIQVKGKADWKESAGHSRFRFKHYTWFRLYLNEYYHPDIFFTIGVDGIGKCLFIKIDFQRERPKTLNEEQKKYLKELMRENSEGPYWTSIPSKILTGGDWNTLINFSVNFINTQTTLFGSILRQVNALAVEKRIARLTWNTNGWLSPSGYDGKSHDPESHEFNYGYGHEEWLFDITKLINGYHYGFLEPVRKQQQAYQNKVYDVWLYTIDGQSKKRFFAGEIKHCEVITHSEALKIQNEYKNRGWLKEMEKQIKLCDGESVGFSNYKGVDLFNIRFKPENLKVEELIELPVGHEAYKQSRYAFASYTQQFEVETYSPSPFEFKETGDLPEDNKATLTRTYRREPKPVQISYLHEKISSGLTRHLKQKYGKSNVTREHPSGYGANRIDIVVRHKGKIIFYEIKTYHSPRVSIREALGQIIEYCCWQTAFRADELVIVTQPHTNIAQICTYINHLKSEFRIPISFVTYDYKNNLLTEH